MLTIVEHSITKLTPAFACKRKKALSDWLNRLTAVLDVTSAQWQWVNVHSETGAFLRPHDGISEHEDACLEMETVPAGYMVTQPVSRYISAYHFHSEQIFCQRSSERNESSQV